MSEVKVKVKEKKQYNIITFFKMVLEPLTQTDYAKEDDLQAEVDRDIKSAEDTESIENLEKNIGIANISLEDVEGDRTAFVKHENVSEILANKNAQEKLARSTQTKNNDKQR